MKCTFSKQIRLFIIDRTQAKGFKLKEGRLKLDIRKKFFSVSVMKQWNRLPREVAKRRTGCSEKLWAASISLEVFMTRLNGTFSRLV